MQKSGIALLLFLGALAGVSADNTAARKNVEEGERPSEIVRVPAGESLQAALDAAVPGQTIVLEAGAEYRGNFVLPAKAGDSFITIASSGADKLLPDVRVSPADAEFMAKLVSPNVSPVLAAAPGAHHYRIVGLDFSAPNVYTYGLVELGSGREKTIEELPHDLEFDRVYLHGDTQVGAKRGIALNSRSTVIKNSYLSDFKGIGQEAQGIAGWNGPGPFEIVNNYIEGAGENIIFGGARNAGDDFVPSDIVIRRNHLFKPLTWKAGHESFLGTKWVVKNLLELKTGKRVTIDGNVLENNWVMGQSGIAVLFTVRTENSANPWNVIEDVAFTNNIIRNSDGGAFNILGRDGDGMGAVRRVTIRNNLLENVSGRVFQLLNGSADIHIVHNTVINPNGHALMMLDGVPASGLVFTENLAYRGKYGIVGSGKADGSATLAAFAPDAVVTRNVIAGAPMGSRYPRGNSFPPSLTELFSDGGYVLAPDCPYRAAGPDGTDLGADYEVLMRAIDGVVRRGE